MNEDVARGRVNRVAALLPGPRHVCGHGAAYIKRFDADTTTLNFLNANYAQEVVRMNPDKVVRVESSTAAKEA